ncbi:MAG: hypothetical protein M0Z67_03180 [Nitrospiraceae bacterium]|nr:hypothetical protein [Nitrospiraceae bacterium]
MIREVGNITFRAGVVAMLACLLPFAAGCVGVGASTINRDRFDYTTALSDSWKSQMLVNIVKVRYGDAPVFLDVASVINSYELSGKGTAGASWKFSPAHESGVNVGGEIFTANRPTITYSPLTGEKFARSLMAPVPPSAILSLVQSGYPVDIVFRALVQSVNGIKNSHGGGSATRRPADPEFYPLLEKLRRIQQSGAIGIRIQRVKEGAAVVLVFGGKAGEEIEADAEVRKILGLDPGARELKVVYGLLPSDNKEIAILSRSMLQVLVDIASRIEVPETDIMQKRVAPTVKEENSSGLPVAPLIRIHSSPQRPEDALVSIPYGNHWFWIDNRDLHSKQIFSFLMFIFTLVETGEKEGAPIITIPVR